MNGDKPGSQATLALVLGIVGLLVSIVAPVAWYIGHLERKAIREGRSSPAGEGQATAGFIMGIIGTVFLAITCICGGLYALFVIGIIGTLGFAAATANSVPSGGGGFAHLEATRELIRVQEAQVRFYQGDLDRDGKSDYARSMEELKESGAFSDGQGEPSVAGYRFKTSGDEDDFEARAEPVSGRGKTLVVDGSGDVTEEGK